MKTPAFAKSKNKSTSIEEPATVQVEVNRMKRVVPLTVVESWLWCLLNMETSHADIATYQEALAKVPIG